MIMNATVALVRDTFREAFARRIFWGFFGCCTALLLFLLFIMRIDVVQGAIATVTIFGRNTQSTDVEGLVNQTQSVIAMVLYFAGMALSVFASAGLVAAVFEPGRIELLLSKPVSRQPTRGGREYSLSRPRFVDYFRYQDRRLGRRIPLLESLHDLHLRGPARRCRAGWGLVG